MIDLPSGCPFAPRCPLAAELCHHDEPQLVAVAGPDHLAACHYHDRLVDAHADEVFAPDGPHEREA
jgi:ABC-type antimicrobial peptide transport system ATPase subunit